MHCQAQPGDLWLASRAGLLGLVHSPAAAGSAASDCMHLALLVYKAQPERRASKRAPVEKLVLGHWPRPARPGRRP
jgi:hypothetical protein